MLISFFATVTDNLELTDLCHEVGLVAIKLKVENRLPIITASPGFENPIFAGSCKGQTWKKLQFVLKRKIE